MRITSAGMKVRSIWPVLSGYIFFSESHNPKPDQNDQMVFQTSDFKILTSHHSSITTKDLKLSRVITSPIAWYVSMNVLGSFGFFLGFHLNSKPNNCWLFSST